MSHVCILRLIIAGESHLSGNNLYRLLDADSQVLFTQAIGNMQVAADVA